MASPLAVGDIIAIATLAKEIIDGLNPAGAPAQFRRLKVQLEELKGIFDDHVRQRNAAETFCIDEGDILREALQNCEQTLDKVRNIVRKYSIILPPQQSELSEPSKTRLNLSRGHIGTRMRTIWRKIEWTTTEKDDFEALMNQIQAHKISLGLIFNIQTRYTTARIEAKTDKGIDMLHSIDNRDQKILGILEEFREACLEYAKHTTFVPSTPTSTSTQPITFSLWRGIAPRTELICQNAIMGPALLGYDETLPLFSCSCPETLHRSTISSYRKSHLAMPYRLVGDDRCWVLYQVAHDTSNSLVNLRITDIPLTHLAEVELVLEEYAAERAYQILKSGDGGNVMASISTDAAEARMLSLMCDTIGLQTSISTVRFTVGGGSSSLCGICDIMILQEKCEPIPGEPGDASSRPRYLQSTISLKYESGEIEHTILILKPDSRVVKEGLAISMANMECIAYMRDKSQPNLNLSETDVDLEFTNPEALGRFFEQTKAMQTELKVQALQEPQEDELPVFQLPIARVRFGDDIPLFIQDADLTIVRNKNSGRNRLIIVSKNKGASLSQQLAEDFFETATSVKDANFRSPTYYVKMDSDCGTKKRTIHYQENGFERLIFSSEEVTHLLELARTAMITST